MSLWLNQKLWILVLSNQCSLEGNIYTYARKKKKKRQTVLLHLSWDSALTCSAYLTHPLPAQQPCINNCFQQTRTDLQSLDTSQRLGNSTGWKLAASRWDQYICSHSPHCSPMIKPGCFTSLPFLVSMALLEQDPVGLLGTKAFVCPPFLVFRKEASFSLQDLPWVPKGRFKQWLIREGRGCGDKEGAVEKQ